MLFQGIGMPLFFVPLTGIALGCVLEREMDSAAGLMNFIRTLSGAFATSMVNTSWENQTRYVHAELAGLTDREAVATHNMLNDGMNMDAVRGSIAWMLQGQSVMVATNHIFMVIAAIFAVAALVIWFAPTIPFPGCQCFFMKRCIKHYLPIYARFPESTALSFCSPYGLSDSLIKGRCLVDEMPEFHAEDISTCFHRRDAADGSP